MMRTYNSARREEGTSLSLFALCLLGVFETCALFHSLTLDV